MRVRPLALVLTGLAWAASSTQAFAQRELGAIRHPSKHLGKVWQEPRHPGAIPGPRGRLRYSTPMPAAPGGFVMQVQKQDGASQVQGEIAQPREIAPRLSACWRPPVRDRHIEVTLRVSFTRDGRIAGEPMITYVRADGAPELREQIRTSILTAVRACTPLRFTPALGQGIAGRSFAIRFIAPAARGAPTAI